MKRWSIGIYVGMHVGAKLLTDNRYQLTYPGRQHAVEEIYR